MSETSLSDLRSRVTAYVTQLFGARHRVELVYHDLDHTQSVAERAHEIALASGVNERDATVLHTAAWFHDVGHLAEGEAAGHEERSVAELRDFFKKEPVPDENFLAEVEGCIMATKVPQSPQTPLQEIMCDADTYHFGTPSFKDTNKKVKEEFTQRGHEELTDGWKEKTIKLLEGHQFFSAYARETLEGGKAENIEKWKKKLNKTDDGEEKGKDKGKADGELKRKEKKEEGLIARGIQTSLRLASENHLKLSDMADGKANILISVNSIIIGVILSVLLRRLEVDTYLTIPTMIFLASSVGTIIVAILATLPKVTAGRFSHEDVMLKRTNLLFFGNFHRSSLEDYSWAMDRLMRDKDYLYGTLIKDIYYLGVVLGRKYRLIRIAYYVFMFGLLLSVVAFVWAIVWNQPPTASQVVTPAKPPL